MQNLERIDNYFNQQTTEEERKAFEQLIATDPAFADEVAFYMNAKAAIAQELKEEKKIRFKALYQQEQKEIPVIKKAPVKKMWLSMAAASVAVAIIALAIFVKPNNSPTALANTYIEKNLTEELGVTMAGSQDSLQQALDFANHGELQEALTLFEAILKYQPANEEVEKYAGIVSLRLEKYDNALQHFATLAKDTVSYGNPAKFYQAITFMKRNNPGDVAKAKVLLQEVKDKNLDKAAVAGEWLQKLK